MQTEESYMMIQFECSEATKHNRLEEQRISLAIMASVVVLTFQYFILVVFNLMGTSLASRIQILSKIIVATVYVYVFPIIWKRSKNKILGTYLVWLVVFLFHYLVFPNNRLYLNDLVIPLFFMSLPTFIHAWSLTDWDIFEKIMEQTGAIVLSLGTVLTILILLGRVSFGAYSMALSYYMLLPAVMYTNKFLNYVSVKGAMLALLSGVIILAIGARGPLLCLGVFLALKLLRSRKLTLGQVSVRLASSVLCGLVLLSFDSIMLSLANFFAMFGIRSRSISLFLQSTVHLSGRDTLYETVWQNLLDKPLWGIGLAGDRTLIGVYVHNLFLEVLSHFGLFFGSLLLSFIVVIAIWRMMAKHRYEMLAIWFAIGVVPLMVSGSYLIDLEFWTFLGLLLGRPDENNNNSGSILNYIS